MTPTAARRYLLRLHLEHGGALLACVGLVVAAAGTGAAVIATLGGVALFVVAVSWAWVEALRMRAPGQPMVGPSSVSAEANRLTGWWYLNEAAQVLGRDGASVEGRLKLMVALTVVAFVAIPVVAVLTS